MKTEKLIWIPRVLVMAFIFFLSLFALDVFSGEAPFVRKMGGFLIHLIPSFVLVAVLVFSWKKPLIGGLFFISLGIASVFFFKTYRLLSSFLMVSIFPAVVGVLFIVFDLVSGRNPKATASKQKGR